MVDFNNETTVATPPGEVVKVLVLERREQVIEALEKYHLLDETSADPGHTLVVVKARLLALWYQVQAMVERRMAQVRESRPANKELQYDDVKEWITDLKELDFEDVVERWEWLNLFIDDMGLTFIDGRAKYDRTRIEDANRKKGL